MIHWQRENAGEKVSGQRASSQPGQYIRKENYVAQTGEQLITGMRK